jgi:hypothetical protein
LGANLGISSSSDQKSGDILHKMAWKNHDKAVGMAVPKEGR